MCHFSNSGHRAGQPDLNDPFSVLDIVRDINTEMMETSCPALSDLDILDGHYLQSSV